MFGTIVEINKVINEFVWVKIGLFLLIGTGVLTTVLTRFFQVVHIKEWWMKTLGGMFSKESKVRKNTEKGSVSQFQALCTALAATIGTGNIAGVSAAICMGGPGAVFWMWVAAFFGMMTSFSENVLGIYYRRKNKNGEWSGGAMYYLKDGLGKYKGCKPLGSVLAVMFSVFVVFASFGIGNMGQVNKIVINLEDAFFTRMGLDLGFAFSDVKWSSVLIGLLIMLTAGLIILGGLQRIAVVAEKVVPFMAIAYILGCIVVFVINIDKLGDVFISIFKFAFGVDAVVGGAVGISIKQVITQGCKRGVFSNEAGLGSAVIVNSSSNTKEPVIQGMWGILQVFIDTFVVCTITAVVVLSSGSIDLETGLIKKGVQDATLVANAFGNVFGIAGNIFIAVSIFLFAFTTILGWSHYGAKAFEYLFGEKSTKFYRIFFVLMIISGALMKSSIAWDISDTFNGMMMIPNLIGVVSLSPVIIKITNNYIERNIKKKDVTPVLSYDAIIQKESEEAINKEN